MHLLYSQKRTKILFIGAILLLIIGCLLYISHLYGDGSQRPIPNSFQYRFIGAQERLIQYQTSHQPAPVLHVSVPQHPHMALKGGNNMHNDAYMSDTYEASGPIGIAPKINSRTQGFGGYGTIAFDHQGRIVGVYSNGRNFQLEWMDPYSLKELSSYDLPSRPWYFFLQGVMPWEYIGAGMYFYLDEQGRAIVPTTLNSIQVVHIPEKETGDFSLIKEYDLSDYVVPMPWPKQDSVAWVLPDWEADIYWYATTAGIVGTVDMKNGTVRTLSLENEIIENSFAVGEEGVFILSDYALYRFETDSHGKITARWRTPYDRGTQTKPGHITRGSGTSVTLLGDLVAITDNAEPRIHLLLIQRENGEVACQIPLFEENRSGTDITAIGFEHAGPEGQSTGQYSIIAENNWGHNMFPFARPTGGITRIDATREPDGSYRCQEIWTSDEKNIGVFKLSLGNGLLYLYFRGANPLITRWYFTALDFSTGDRVFKQLAGTGIGYNNWAGAIFLHPDGGVAYSTTIFGLVMMQDYQP
jgi:hypothetical protein